VAVRHFVQHVEPLVVELERRRKLTHRALARRCRSAFDQRGHDRQLHRALAFVRVDDGCRDLLERDRFERVGVDIDAMNARDALDQSALGLGELVIGERDIAQHAQNRVELARGEDVEFHGPA
jgi:hypothetical protein